jgi:hypothetical protein
VENSQNYLKGNTKVSPERGLTDADSSMLSHTLMAGADSDWAVTDVERAGRQMKSYIARGGDVGIIKIK